MRVMRVKVLEKKLKDSGYDLVEADTITVPAEVGEKWCGHGWVEDVDGTIATGERIVQGAIVVPRKVTHKSRKREG